MREMNPEGVIRILNELIETCHSGQQSFAEAANHLASAAIKNFCAEQSRMRAQFSADLQEEVKSLGGDGNNIGNTGSKAAALAWFNAAGDSEDHAIVAACENAEDAAIRQYETALAYPLPATVRSVVEHQCRSVKQAHDQIKTWGRRAGA